MSTKPPPSAKLHALQYLGYAAGDAANNLTFSMASLFLLLYYTDVVGLSAALVGTMFLVVRAWDAFADIAADRIVDKTRTRWGKFRQGNRTHRHLGTAGALVRLRARCDLFLAQLVR